MVEHKFSGERCGLGVELSHHVDRGLLEYTETAVDEGFEIEVGIAFKAVGPDPRPRHGRQAEETDAGAVFSERQALKPRASAASLRVQPS